MTDEALEKIGKTLNLKNRESEGERLSRNLDLPVALVCMPFVSAYHPSLQIGLLKAIALRNGFPAASFHLHLDFAKDLGLKAYAAIAEMRGRLLGDWLFSLDAFGEEAPDAENCLLEDFSQDIDVILRCAGLTRQQLVEIRTRAVPAYLDRLVAEIPWARFRVVGFTCTFQQSVASFALARRIKAAHPGVVMLFGGANFEGDMGAELVRSIAAVDYAVIGEADEAFPAFLAGLARNDDLSHIPGLGFRRGGETVITSASKPFRGLDELPTPSYDEYFDRAERLALLPRSGRRAIGIPVESSRGCWWGEKHHCTFCGLNGGTMAFRSKSPDRFRDELAELAARYHNFRFCVVDNIVDYKYYSSFFRDLAQRRLDFEIFYEVKANLTREQIKTLRDGGVQRIQPGIESLSTDVLRLMDKGVSALQNVNTLRWADYYDLGVSWNVIWGFPGETGDAIDAQTRLIPLLWHLQPPTGGSAIWLERFSPLFLDRRRFAAKRVTPEASYAYTYPKGVDLDRAAYFFDYELEGCLASTAYDSLAEAISVWRSKWESGARPKFTFWAAGDYLQIEDLRDADASGTYNFEGPLAAIYLACSDRPEFAARIKTQISCDAPLEDIEAACKEFARRGLMMQDGKQFLSLALPATGGR